MRCRITYVDKVEFLRAFKAAFFKAFIESNIQGGFAGSGLVLYNPKRVLAKLDSQPRTPTPEGSPGPASLPP